MGKSLRKIATFKIYSKKNKNTVRGVQTVHVKEAADERTRAPSFSASAEKGDRPTTAVKELEDGGSTEETSTLQEEAKKGPEGSVENEQCSADDKRLQEAAPAVAAILDSRASKQEEDETQEGASLEVTASGSERIENEADKIEEGIASKSKAKNSEEERGLCQMVSQKATEVDESQNSNDETHKSGEKDKNNSQDEVRVTKGRERSSTPKAETKKILADVDDKHIASVAELKSKMLRISNRNRASNESLIVHPQPLIDQKHIEPVTKIKSKMLKISNQNHDYNQSLIDRKPKDGPTEHRPRDGYDLHVKEAVERLEVRGSLGSVGSQE